MKESEIELLALANKSNHMWVKNTQVKFGIPQPTTNVGYNTWIVVSAVEDDNEFGKSTTLRYNRLDARHLGDKGVIRGKIVHGSDIIAELQKVILKETNIPCTVDEFKVRFTTRPTTSVMVCIVDFINHPMVFGTLTVRFDIEIRQLADLIQNTTLNGFVNHPVYNA